MISRNIIVIIAILSLLACSGCNGRSGKGTAGMQSIPDTGKAVISFTQKEHDFGKVTEGEKVGCIFTFRNTGTANLFITSAITSCGCTVPEYDTKPIPPDEYGKLEVIFDTSGREGFQTKTITVRSNAANTVVLLQIKAEVITNSNN